MTVPRNLGLNFVGSYFGGNGKLLAHVQASRSFARAQCRRGRSEISHFCTHFSGKKKEPKPKLLSPDIFWWGRGLPREGVGAKKFGMSLETQGIKLFWRDIPGFCGDIPGVPEKFENKKFGFSFRSLIFEVNCSHLPLSSRRMREKRRKKEEKNIPKNNEKAKKNRNKRKGESFLRPHPHQHH